MFAQTRAETASQTLCTDLHTRLIEYASCVEDLRTPTEVLDDLCAITTSALPLSVLGAVRLPIKSNDWESIQLGKSLFLHKDVPKGWWEELGTAAHGKFHPLLFLARSSMASLTWTEVRRKFEPIGIDLFSYELALKYGIRDGLSCPVAGRWLVIFWSRQALSKVLTQEARIMIFAAASFAALRLEQLACLDVDRIGSHVQLTPRETAVLQLMSMGSQSRAVAEALGLGQETIRSHLKKAQVKLGANNRAHAIAEAIRQNLIVL